MLRSRRLTGAAVESFVGFVVIFPRTYRLQYDVRQIDVFFATTYHAKFDWSAAQNASQWLIFDPFCLLNAGLRPVGSSAVLTHSQEKSETKAIIPIGLCFSVLRRLFSLLVIRRGVFGAFRLISDVVSIVDGWRLTHYVAEPSLYTG